MFRRHLTYVCEPLKYMHILPRHMALIDLKCPQCQRDIGLDDTHPIGFCVYCGTEIPLRTVETFELRIEILSLIPTSVVEVRLDGHQDKRSFMMMGTARYMVSPGRHTVSVVCGKLSTEFEVDVTEDCAQNVNVGLKGIKVGGSGLPQLL